MEKSKSGRGGYRPGAGRKPSPKMVLGTAATKIEARMNQKAATDVGGNDKPAASYEDPKEFLLALMNDPDADVRLRSDAAKALMPFAHHKLGEGGKKEQKQAEAKKAATGKFSAAAPPKLVASGGSRL